ncbi:MAG: 2-hydroxyacyl-CoA dehydratase [Firmicutes bacterium]|nr:2-hydroxyacyl-CoA dehydratase [Bacillota bacterium]
MKVRGCAKKSKAFTSLLDVYTNRDQYAVEAKKKGKTVIAVFGSDVPVEILHAAGMLPVQVYGGKNLDLTAADKYLEYAFDPCIRSQFEKMVDGTYSNLVDFVVMSRSSDALTRVFYYLREIRLTEPDVPVPPVYFIEQFFLRNFDNQRKNITRFNKFRKVVEAWAARELRDEEIWESCRLYNEDRQYLRDFSALRHGEHPTVLGSEFLVAVGASMFMPVEKHIELMKQLLEDAKAWDEVKAVNIFLTGSAQEDTDLYEQIEALGGNVTAEDHDWGDRYAAMDIDLNMITPERALVDRYWLRTPSTKHALIRDRVASVVADSERGEVSKGLIFVHQYEESPSWDYPSQIKALKDRGIECLALTKQKYRIEDNAELKEKLGSFLKGGDIQ